MPFLLLFQRTLKLKPYNLFYTIAKTIFTKTHKDLVNRLVKARTSAKLKQADVAKRLGRTQSYISKLEAGQRRVDTVQLSELAAIYKKSLLYFIK